MLNKMGTAIPGSTNIILKCLEHAVIAVVQKL